MQGWILTGVVVLFILTVLCTCEKLREDYSQIGWKKVPDPSGFLRDTPQEDLDVYIAVSSYDGNRFRKSEITDKLKQKCASLETSELVYIPVVTCDYGNASVRIEPCSDKGGSKQNPTIKFKAECRPQNKF